RHRHWTLSRTACDTFFHPLSMKHSRSVNRRLTSVVVLGLLATVLGVHAQVGGAGAAARANTATARAYTSNTQVGEAIITSDPQTRSLVIVTDDETNENIRQVIQSLDRPKPQV